MHGLQAKIELLIKMGQFEEAMKTIDDALEKSPEDPSMWNNKGQILWAQERMREAEACFDQVLKIVPEEPMALSNKAACNIYYDRFSEALTLLEKSLKGDPTSVQAWLNHASCHDEMGSYLAALQSYVRANTLAPRGTELKEQATGIGINVGQRAVKKARKEKKLIDEALALKGIAELYFDWGEYPAAFAFYIQSLGCLKRDNSPQYDIVYKELFKNYDRIFQLDPELPGKILENTRQKAREAEIETTALPANYVRQMMGQALAQRLLVQGFENMQAIIANGIQMKPRFSAQELEDVWHQVMG